MGWAPWQQPSWTNHSSSLLNSLSRRSPFQVELLGCFGKMVRKSSLSMWPEELPISLWLEAESSRWMTNQSWHSATTVGMALSHFSFWPWMRQGHKLVMGIGNLTKQRPLERTCQGSVRNSTIEPVMAHLLKQWGKRWLERGRLRAIWVHTLIESHWEQLGSSVAVSMCMRPRQTTHISWSSGDSMGPMQVIQSLKLILA